MPTKEDRLAQLKTAGNFEIGNPEAVEFAKIYRLLELAEDTELQDRLGLICGECEGPLEPVKEHPDGVVEWHCKRTRKGEQCYHCNRDYDCATEVFTDAGCTAKFFQHEAAAAKSREAGHVRPVASERPA